MLYNLIGVDPAFREKGFCLCIIDTSKEVRFITFDKYLHFISWVQNEMPINTKVSIENSYLQNKTFNMNGSKAVVARTSRNVGMNQAASEIAYQLFCEYTDTKRVLNISPKRKGAKWKDDKIMKYICLQKGFKLPKKARFSQDERDAFKLCTFLL